MTKYKLRREGKNEDGDVEEWKVVAVKDVYEGYNGEEEGDVEEAEE